MRITGLTILFLSSFATSCFASSLNLSFDWNQYQSEHFTVHYHSTIPSKYIREFTRKSEDYYHLIGERFGFSRFDFWLQEDKIDIFVFKTRTEYIKVKTGPAINTYYFEKKFFEVILPRKLSPLILREFTGPKAWWPIWFEQGLGLANEKQSFPKYFLLAKDLVKNNTFLSASEMEGQDLKQLSSSAGFYPSCASLVMFLIQGHNSDYFVQFCRQLRDGSSFYTALDKVYGFRDAQDLNGKFLEFLNTISCQDIANNKGIWLNW